MPSEIDSIIENTRNNHEMMAYREFPTRTQKVTNISFPQVRSKPLVKNLVDPELVPLKNVVTVTRTAGLPQALFSILHFIKHTFYFQHIQVAFSHQKLTLLNIVR